MSRDSLERVPDHDPVAERGALGAALIDHAAADVLVRELRREDFYAPDLALVFDAVQALHHEGAPIDLVTVTGKLQTTGRLEEAGGDAAVSVLADDALPPNAAYYCRRVKEGLERREARRAAEGFIQDLDERKPLAEATAGFHKVLLAAAARPDDNGDGTPAIVRVGDVQRQAVRWLWPGRVPLGKVSLLAGDPGLGKSMLTLDMGARLSTGRPWPDAPDTTTEPGGVIILSAEDDVADTIRPRLEAAGADLSRVHVLNGVEFQAKGGQPKTVRVFRLDRDLPVLDKAIAQTPGCRLVIIDPITAYLGHTDSHVNAEVRAVLAPLKEAAERHDVAIVGVAHLNKSSTTPAQYRVSGSLAFTAAARAVWLIVKDPDNPTRRLMLPGKNNLAPDGTGLGYTIIESPDLSGGPVLAWEPAPVMLSVDDALAPDADSDGRGALREAAAWLREALADGPVSVKDLQGWAKDAGLGWSTLKRAKGVLRAVSRKRGPMVGGAWEWALPGTARVEGDQALPHENLVPFDKVGLLRAEGPENAVFEAPCDGDSFEGDQPFGMVPFDGGDGDRTPLSPGGSEGFVAVAAVATSGDGGREADRDFL